MASAKEDAARQLLEKSYQQANIWAQGPLQLVAEVTLPQADKPALQIKYNVDWASPNKWRSEWSGGGYSRVVVVDKGKMYQSSSTPVPPLPVLEFERALGALTGHGFVGPIAAVPDLSGAKLDMSSQKFDKIQGECIHIKNAVLGLCIDASSAQALATFSNDAWNFLYSDYAVFGSKLYPTSIRHVAGKQVLFDGHIRVTVPTSLAESVFAPPENAVIIDYPACSETNGTLHGTRLEKKVTPEYPQNAKMNHHQGTVLLYATIGKDGSVQKLKPLSTGWPELQTSAMEAVKDWKYSPYMRCGQPVETELLISVNYSLSSF